jgi:hypothetical protein
MNVWTLAIPLSGLIHLLESLYYGDGRNCSRFVLNT